MQNAADLRKLVSGAETSTGAIVAALNDVRTSPMPGEARQEVLSQLANAWIAAEKGDDDVALAHVSKARTAVRRALTKGR